MNLGLKLLDELDFAQAPLVSQASSGAGASVSLDHVVAVNGSSRSIPLRSPFFVRSLGPADLGGAWDAFCQLLRRRGIPLFSSEEALTKVSAASVPARWSGRPFGEPFQANELASADLFEVSCHDRQRQQWKWPAEIVPERLGGLLQSVRLAAGGDTPVGISLPLGCHRDDLLRCLEGNVDFISLNCRFTHFEASDLFSLVQCRQLAGQFERPHLPILVTAPIESLTHAYKLIALGASAVSVDDILRPSIAQDMRPTEKEVSIVELRRSLPSLALSINPSLGKRVALPQVDQLLARAEELLTTRLKSVGASKLSSFTRESLRSVSERAERITGVARFEQG